MPTIRVVVRFRPINSREKTTASENNWSGKEICPIYVDDKHLQEYDETSDSKRIGKQVRLSSKSFAFDEILVWVSQQTAFERIGLPVVTDALNGINGTIFAYGQTGSGKTFSMFGPEPLTENNANLLGIIPRCCAQIFANLSTNEKIKGYRIDVSFFEIYIHNKIRDLLHPAKKGDPALKVRDGLKGVFIENLKPETATNLQEILALIALANSHRTVSSTKMNATSSRSHSVMRVQIRIEMKDGSRCKSQINFGDLAGSEKVNKTGATGQTLKEAMAINQSLTLLGNVIAALAKIGSGKKGKGSMVPFRDSALTHVLKDSLSGNCKTTLVTAASPHKFNLIETVSTFRFASRCKLVKTKAEKNVVLSPSQMRKMIEKLKIEVIGLKQKLLKGGGNGGNNDDDSVTGIGVKILWPSDFQPWANDKKVFSTLEKQINSQIKCVLKKTYQDEKDINTIPYVVCLSAPGTKREVTVKFHCDENDSGEYNRNNCIDICNKLAETISKIDNNKLKPALRNYDICESFSQPSIGELKEIISSQKLQINLINEQLENVKKENEEVYAEIEEMKTNFHNLENSSLRSRSIDVPSHGLHHMSGQSITSYHSMSNTPTSGYGNFFVNKVPKRGNFRQQSIFTGDINGNLLKTEDLLTQLLHSKFEVLKSNRSLQLLQVRYMCEQKKIKQLRYVISRMQSEYMDLKSQSILSTAVLTDVADSYNQQNESVVTIVTSPAFQPLTDDDNELIESALDDILNDMDMNDLLDDSDDDLKYNQKNKNKNGKIPILRALASLTKIDENSTTKLSESRSNNRRRLFPEMDINRNDKRRASASDTNFHSFGIRNGRNNRKRNSILNRMVNNNNSKNKRCVTFASKGANYLWQATQQRKDLLNDMISFESIDDDDENIDDNIENNNNSFIPHDISFINSINLWKGYSKQWIQPWTIHDVIQWLKKIDSGNLRQYSKIFRRNKINGRKLLDLQMHDLLDMNIDRIHAEKILKFTNSIVEDLNDDDDDDDDIYNDIDWDLHDFDEFLDDDVDIDFDTILSNEVSECNSEDDIDDTDDYDTNEYNIINKTNDRFYNDPTSRLTDLIIEQLTNSEIKQILKLNKLNYNIDTVNFNIIKKYYYNDNDNDNEVSQVLLLTLYGLLCNKIGLLHVSEWNDLLELVKSEKSDINIDNKVDYKSDTSNDNNKSDNDYDELESDYFDDYMVIINSFVDVYGIYNKYCESENNNKLTIKGSKYFVCSLRQTIDQIHELRDNEDAVLFFAGLKMDELEKFVRKLPNTLWMLINNPFNIEYVYRELIKKTENQNNINIKQNMFSIYLEQIGIKFNPKNIIQQSIKVMNILNNNNNTINLDIWIKKLFIKRRNNDEIISKIYNELLNLNQKLQLKYQQMYHHYSAHSIQHSLQLDDQNQNKPQYIKQYKNLNELIFNVAKFGTCGKCFGIKNIPKQQFTCSKSENATNIKESCQLNSKFGWTSAINNNNNQNHWIKIDLGKITNIFAIAIQGGKYGSNEWCTNAYANYSISNEDNSYKEIQIKGNDNNNKLQCFDNNTIQVYIFENWIKARYIKLNILKYHNKPSLRWDILFGDILFV